MKCSINMLGLKKNKSNKIKLLAGISAGILLIAAVFTSILIKLHLHKMPHPITPVISISKAVQKDWQPHLINTGYVIAKQGITLTSQTAGTITSINFKSGDEVKAGRTLVTINNTSQKSALLKAKSQYALEKISYARVKALGQTGAISKQDIDNAYAEYMQARASVLDAESELNKTIIKAPFAGRIGITNIALGDYISPGSTIANIQNLDNLYVDISLPEKFLNKIAVGEQVNITTNAYPNQVFKGKVVAIGSQVDINTGMFTVRASINNYHHLLLPGNFVQTTLYYNKPIPALLVPQTAIVYSAQGDYVYQVKNKHAIKVPVKTAEQIDDKVIITSSLNPGDAVISAGTNKITLNNMLININNHHG